MSRGVTSRAGIPLQPFHHLPYGACSREEGCSLGQRRTEQPPRTPAGAMVREGSPGAHGGPASRAESPPRAGD